MENEIEEKEEKVDSLTIGSASKGGAVKIYHSFSDPEGFKKKIDNASAVRQYAQEKGL